MTIEAKMQEISAGLDFLEPMQKIEYLIDISKKAESLPEKYKTESNKVSGCASATWLIIKEGQNGVVINTDSEAAIVKGLLQLLEKSFNEHTKEEIIAVNGQAVLDTIGLGGSITNRRMNGFASAIEMVQRKLKENLI